MLNSFRSSREPSDRIKVVVVIEIVLPKVSVLAEVEVDDEVIGEEEGAEHSLPSRSK